MPTLLRRAAGLRVLIRRFPANVTLALVVLQHAKQGHRDHICASLLGVTQYLKKICQGEATRRNAGLQPGGLISRWALAPVFFDEMKGISTGASALRLMNRLNQQTAN